MFTKRSVGSREANAAAMANKSSQVRVDDRKNLNRTLTASLPTAKTETNKRRSIRQVVCCAACQHHDRLWSQFSRELADPTRSLFANVRPSCGRAMDRPAYPIPP